MVNLRGELIGINSAIIGPAGGNVGIGFAVPSNMARAVMNQIVRYGEVRRGRLGIEMDDLTPELAKKLGAGSLEGAVVAAVQPDSPAHNAGLRERDVVVALNGRPIRNAAELRARLGLTPIGEQVELRVNRGGEARMLRAQIAAPQEYAPGKGQAIPQLAGLQAVEIERGSPLYQHIQGLIVSAVENNSRALHYGFRAGDVIYAINNKRIRTLAEFQTGLRAAERGYTVSLLRGDVSVTITIR